MAGIFVAIAVPVCTVDIGESCKKQAKTHFGPRRMRLLNTVDKIPPTPCFYLNLKQDDFNKIPELQVCIAEALYDVDSIVADPGAYTKEELASLHNQILSNLVET